MGMRELIREKYLSELRPFYHDSGTIKVLTGIRRCGKSTLMDQIASELKENGVEEDRIAHIDLDKKRYRSIRTPEALEEAIDAILPEQGGNRYLFVDEIQNLRDFEPLINAYRNDGVSVFITGSNSYLLSGDLVTKLTGRYVEFEIGTFSFGEIKAYYELNGLPFDKGKEFDDYLIYGGYPKRFDYPDASAQERYIQSVIEETITKDILKSRKVRDRGLLKRILEYVVSTPGAEISTTSISDFLRSERIKTLPKTVGRHLELIYSSKIASKCMRYDINGKKSLKTHYKSYVADPSIHSLYPQPRSRLKMGHVIENVVHIELVSRGYAVSVGKLRDLEVDFVVTKGRKVAYVQVAYLIESEATMDREIGPLLRIKDAFPKYIISMSPVQIDQDGVRMLHLIDDFLIGDKFTLR